MFTGTDILITVYVAPIVTPEQLRKATEQSEVFHIWWNARDILFEPHEIAKDDLMVCLMNSACLQLGHSGDSTSESESDDSD
jgi:hypothetical protein